jgi:hypothetical protein
MSTKSLENLKVTKETIRAQFAGQWRYTPNSAERVNKLTEELRHIKAVLIARYSTLPLWGDK